MSLFSPFRSFLAKLWLQICSTARIFSALFKLDGRTFGRGVTVWFLFWILGFGHFNVLSLSGISPRTLSWTPLWGSSTYRLEIIRWPITFRLSVSAGWASRFLYSVMWYSRLPYPAERTTSLLNSVRWSHFFQFLTLLCILESSEEFFYFPDICTK